MVHLASTATMSRERMLELDYALRKAIDEHNGEAAMRLVEWHSAELRQALSAAGDDAGQSLIREAADRLLGHVERATAARNDLRAEINGMDVRRKLTGIPGAVYSGRGTACSFLA